MAATESSAHLEKTKICRVCGDKALAFNFSGLSCECCKIFFRRNAATPEKLKCRKSNNCPIDFTTRRCCPKCRLDKCFAIGMDLEKPKPRNRKKKAKVDSIISASAAPSPPIAAAKRRHTPDVNIRDVLLEKEEINENLHYDLPAVPKKYFHKKYSNKLNEYELDLIAQVKQAMKVFEDEHTLPVVGVATKVQDVFNLSGLYARRIVKLCKSIPAFKILNKTDQFHILKPFYFDISAIRMAWLFDREKDGIPFISSEVGDSAIFVPINLCNQFSNKELSQTHRQFAMGLNLELENDATICNLVIVQAMFKPQENISCPEFVRYYYYVFSRLLKRYLENKYKCAERAGAKYDGLMAILDNLGMIHENLKQAILELDLSQLTEVVYDVMNLANCQ